jgi:hypothetical protein
MPAPIVPALIAAGGAVAGQGINALAQGSMNRKTREWNEKMYGVQRQHALQDWEMQQNFNSPTAQMKRLQEAGLNPNLIYGSGGGTTTAQPVRGTEVKSWSPQAPQFDVPSAIMAYQDARMKQAQYDNIAASTQTQYANAALITANIGKALADTDTKRFDLGSKMSLYENQQAVSNLTRQILETQLMQNVTKANEQEFDLNLKRELRDNTVQQAMLKTLQQRLDAANTAEQRNFIQAQIKNVQADAELKRLDINLFNTKGYKSNESMYLRALGDALDDPNPAKLGKSFLLMLMEGKTPGTDILSELSKWRKINPFKK